MVTVASLLPAVLYAAVNLAMGQDALPNSVVAKSTLGGGTSGIRVTLGATLDALAKDPVVLVGAILALAYCVAACFGGPHRYFVLAATVVVTSVLHSALATYGWFERYQAYLVAMVVLFVLQAAQECVPARLFRAVPVMLITAGILLAPAKWALLAKTPAAAADTYLQRYQAARFVERYYPGQPIATGEVGYIGLRHDGPILDVLGLANHEVLAARRDNRDNSQFWTDIVRRSGAHVVIVYPLSILYDTPKQWILVGELTLHQTTVTAYEPTLQFWAPDVARRGPAARQPARFPIATAGRRHPGHRPVRRYP